MREMIKTTVALLVICFVTALGLAFVNSITKETIVIRAQADAQEQRRQVMPDAKTFKQIDGWNKDDKSGIIREVFEAFDGTKAIGYVFGAYPKGYGGEIKVTVGVVNNKISGVKIGDNKETPGLGTKAADESFVGQYKNADISKTFKVIKTAPKNENEIEAISGATISSKAVTKAVQASADLTASLLKNGGETK